MRTVKPLVALAATFLVLAACASQKEPAEQVVSRVDSALSEFRADAEKYAAEELKSVDESVANLKKQLAKQDYGAVVQGGTPVLNAVNSLKDTVAQRKVDAEQMLAAATEEWNSLTAALPAQVDTLQKRVDQIAKTKKLPKGLDKAGFETAKTDFDNLKTQWTQAGADFAEGKAAEALRKARAVKASIADLATRLEAKLS
ncbi:MAG TPA: hypothetical protein VMF52_11090 [Steroidobacteraceae bacterium]|nr:hypothetical protein [Steroidobacteraceae bacterium]